jgi:Co/Zn/Cd efflux system component
LEIEGTKSVEDLHVWKTGSKDTLLTAHIVVKKLEANSAYAKKLIEIKQKLKSTYNINHSTIQLVSIDYLKEVEDECEHCN